MTEIKKKKTEKRNTTVWLKVAAIMHFDKIARSNSRSRNYVLARILEGIADMSPQQMSNLLQEIKCKELQ